MTGLEVSMGLALTLMVAVTYFTRISGAVVMSFIPLSNKVKRFLSAISGSVFVAIIVPAAVEGDLAAKAAVIMAVVASIFLRNAVLAMLTGVMSAILVRAVI